MVKELPPFVECKSSLTCSHDSETEHYRAEDTPIVGWPQLLTLFHSELLSIIGSCSFHPQPLMKGSQGTHLILFEFLLFLHFIFL